MMNIFKLFKECKRRRLFMKIYFSYLDRLNNQDMAIYLALRDYKEIINLSFSAPQKQTDTQQG